MKRVKVKMLKDHVGSDESPKGDSLGPSKFEEGQEYEVCNNLAKNLVAAGLAELCKGEELEVEPVAGAENKMLGKKSKKEKSES